MVPWIAISQKTCCIVTNPIFCPYTININSFPSPLFVVHKEWLAGDAYNLLSVYLQAPNCLELDSHSLSQEIANRLLIRCSKSGQIFYWTSWLAGSTYRPSQKLDWGQNKVVNVTWPGVNSPIKMVLMPVSSYKQLIGKCNYSINNTKI